MSCPPSDERWTTHSANLTLYQCLSTPTPKRPVVLPNELILQILTHPSRWLCTHDADFPDPNATTNLRIRVSQGEQLILSTGPLAENDLLTLRCIVFTFKSKDQGWSSFPRDRGSYRNTWTWFEARVGGKPPVAQLNRNADEQSMEQSTNKEQKRWELQRNRHSGQEAEEYRIELDRDHELYKNLRQGSKIELYAGSAYPGWANNVYAAGIEVWCVDDLR